MSDLLIPILLIVIMLVIIEEMESPLFLLVLGILFAPMGMLFLSTGNYTTMFQAPLTYQPYIRWLIGGMLSSVSIMAFMRLMFIRRNFANGAVKES